MKYKHIQVAHEIRMWTMTLLTLGMVTNQVLKYHPEAKEVIYHPIRSIKNKFTKDDKPQIVEVRIVDERES